MTFLEINLTEFLSSLGLASIAIPIIQILIAGIPTALKRWFAEKNDFSKRVNYLVEKNTEELSVLLTQIFNRGLNTSIPLRGETPVHPDLVYIYQKKTHSCHFNIFRLKALYSRYKVLNKLLLYIAIVGLVLSVLVFFKSIVAYVLVLSLLLIVIEIVIIVLMYNKVEILEDYEHEASK